MKKFRWYRRVYWAIRYGEWSAGVFPAKYGRPFFHYSHVYYDGDHYTWFVGKYYIGVSY